MTVQALETGRLATVEGVAFVRPEATRQDIYRNLMDNVRREQALEGNVITLAFICEPNDL
ncbi:hypothetical protein ACXNSR_18995 [Streptomyces sp. NC-S4]